MAAAPGGVESVVSECWALVQRCMEGTKADLDGALAAFDRLPPDHPAVPQLAGALAFAIVDRNDLREPVYSRRLVGLAELIGTDNLPPQLAALVDLHASVLRLTDRHGNGDATTFRLVGTEIKQAVESLAAGIDRGDEDAAPARSGLEIMSVLTEVTGAVRRRQFAHGLDHLRRAESLVERLRASDPDAAAHYDRYLAFLGEFLEVMNRGGFAAATEAEMAALERQRSELRSDMQSMPGWSDYWESRHLAIDATMGTTRADPASLDTAIEQWERTLAWEHRQGVEGRPVEEGAGRAYLTRYLVTENKADLVRSIALLEKARDVAVVRDRAHWPDFSTPLGYAYFLDGRPDLARTTLLTGLRASAWKALLQYDTADIQLTVRTASNDAIEAAQILLAAGDGEGAVSALETGRGLIVFAAQQTADIPARLAAMGEHALAEQWRSAVRESGDGDVPPELRLRVIGTLVGAPIGADRAFVGNMSDSGFDLFDPPSAAEIRGALGALGADALVYLVGAEGDEDGFVVVVPAAGEVGYGSLPELRNARVRGFERFVGAMSRRVRGERVGEEAQTTGLRGGAGAAAGSQRDLAATSADGPADVASLCDWAWQAAIGPLLEVFDPPHDRPARLILVPMQELALVPWHAARHQEDGRTRYAMERAVFSYAASVRMVCAASRQSVVALDGSGLVVGDPETGTAACDLPMARIEALSIREALYPTARYVGRRADGTTAEDGPGAPDQLTAWLTSPDGGTLLHLACHGVVRAGTDRAESSYLLLHDGRLSAERMIESLSDAPGHDIGLAVLAACSTAKSGRGYDEVFNLGTVLLAQGVRSVVSAQWPVPDGETSVLMFMLHHFIRQEGMAPADALRAAQLWMLGDRVPPDSMPHALRQRSALGGAPEISSWAGFIHSGR